MLASWFLGTQMELTDLVSWFFSGREMGSWEIHLRPTSSLLANRAATQLIPGFGPN